MRFFVRADKSLGGSRVYARLKNSDSPPKYWNFTTSAWVGTDIDNNTRVYLSEFADGDPKESLYSGEADIPAGGPWIQEAVDDNDGSVFAYDDSVMGELEVIPTTKSGWQQKLNFIFQYLALRRTATGSLETMYKDDNSTVLGTSSLSDDNVTFKKDKVG
jgi:hypothetical protein